MGSDTEVTLVKVCFSVWRECGSERGKRDRDGENRPLWGVEEGGCPLELTHPQLPGECTEYV